MRFDVESSSRGERLAVRLLVVGATIGGIGGLACGRGQASPSEDSETSSASVGEGSVGTTPAGDTTDAGTGSMPASTTDAASTDESSEGDDTTAPTQGCFDPGVVPPSVAPFGFAMPSVADERAAYERWGLTWDPQIEPMLPADPVFAVHDPDIHGDTESDDLWTSLAMHVRSGEPGYLDRATAWRRYFVEDYRSCIGGDYASFCYDKDAFGADHLYGWGLVAWSEAMQDEAALAEAEALGAEVEQLWTPGHPYACYVGDGCMSYGPRGAARHLLLITRLAEVTGSTRWAELRDRIVETILSSATWDADYGTYFTGEYTTDSLLGPGAWAAGQRLQSSFMLAVLNEAMDHAYRTTGNEELRARMLAMSAYVDEYGLDPQYEYTASWFGIVDGAVWHSYGQEPVEFWDPVYTTSLVNVLVRGWRYSCDPHFLDRARYFFERGNRGVYGEPIATAVPDGEIHHFVDTIFDTSSASQYFGYNKGELQYTYLLFAPEPR